MDPPGPMLLPKGILINSSTVYDEVAGYSTLPADKVRQFWHVYTTTNKKLKDPTARRLENFWWHVWGSDRSKLSGRVLARIFEDISLGPTIVPLRGPPNRWEGPDAPPLTIDMIVAHLQSKFPVKTENVAASYSQKEEDGVESDIPSSGRKQPIRKEPSSLSARQVRSGGRPDTEVTDAGCLQTSIAMPCADSVTQNDHKASSKLSARENVALGKQPMMRRSQSSTVPDRPRELSMTKPKRSLFTEATSSTTNVAAQGTIIDQAGSTRHLPQISTSSLAQDDHMSPHGGSSASSLLESRLTPTQPSSSAALPLGRTKSQLTLLLEREKERSRS
ncbi:hypothetical protein LMH87_002232 [Akanthomyces muscarius]|uniref:Nitrogen regulatory protein areA GATA-like domain-containing protein n=1 Tax=Akanthomyces muscarius TaxID=2231603 RepID=A0A9W8Q7X6_AKAMU|nr:hypothetical protein LMH87_002232 [Akanthomyces muscarius]KAJ4147725.1 hypothetical protein LMH87_002232 [Akanthomyces muscarius]